MLLCEVRFVRESGRCPTQARLAANEPGLEHGRKVADAAAGEQRGNQTGEVIHGEVGLKRQRLPRSPSR